MILYSHKEEGHLTNRKGTAMAKILVFDTETTSLDKPFCYDLGYVIFDSETQCVELRRHFIIEQNWHNLPLFESAYYKEKRPQYVTLMRSKKAQLVKWGYATQTLARDIKQYDITDAYAYNSDFDDKVFSFNCDWFKTINPLDNVDVHDIWGYASTFITNTDDYIRFCEMNRRFTDTGNYKGSAEVVYQYITNSPSFTEVHMGLYDSEIESMILLYCLTHNAKLGQNYEVKKIIPRRTKKPFTIKINGEIVYKGEYLKKYVRNDTYNFTTGE